MTNSRYKQAILLQEELRRKVSLEDRIAFDDISIIAGADMCFSKRAGKGFAVMVAFTFPQLDIIEVREAVGDVDFPYIPGLLSFREIPLIKEAYGQLTTKPDLIVCDGQGYAHPRRMGLATHLGLELDVPTIGAAKSRLTGEYDEPEATKGSRTPLMDQDERIGTVLRTRDNVKPMFVSPGHGVSFETAVRVVIAATPKYRVPEVTRQPDRLVAELKRRWIRLGGIMVAGGDNTATEGTRTP